ncbi:MAG: hypothetical protein H6765_01485 [Candidatus Peribacteria bacterium]|nr:MAG: hypothetical protein H6765_01485 [Candidatus Peribacteria bacterium]
MIEPKFDGASVELIYHDGAFAQAITRGDGLRGEDITPHLSVLPSVPKYLQGPLASI